MPPQPSGPPDVRRAAGRAVSEDAPGVRATHSFSFGSHYDPANLGFGPVVCHDDHALAPGRGYDDHPHADLEIVSWVLDGALVHRSGSPASGTDSTRTDSTMTDSTVVAGGAQVLSAGSGLVHSETGEPGAGTTRFVQTWLRPDEPGLPPSYAATAGPVAAAAGLLAVAGAGSELPVGVAGATLWLGTAAGRLALPEAPLLHLYLPRGTARLEDGTDLGPGDAVRLRESGGRLLRLGAGAELLVWSFASGDRRER